MSIGIKTTVGMLLALGAASIAHAGDAVNAACPVKIASQPLGTALQELAKQSGIQIIFLSNLTDGREAPAVYGTVSPRAALDALLRGTDLTFQQLNDRTIEVRSNRAFRKTSLGAASEVSSRIGEVAGGASSAAAFHDVTRPVRLAQAEPSSSTDSSAPPSTATPERVTVQEIIVTARKVRENQQDTPVAITAFSGDALVERQIFATDKLTQIVPNLQFGSNAPLAGNNSSSQVFIRGIGQTDPTSTVDPGVGMYIDDVYIGTAVGARMDLRDISSVQVLRGPQGNALRPQHHRRRDPAVDHRPG